MKTANVIQKLKASHSEPGKIPEISRSANLPISWLYKVARGNIKAPQAERIDALREYFIKSEEAA